MLYLYGLIEKRLLPDRCGLDGAPLTRVDADGISAVTSELGQAPTICEESLWEHESVLEALMQDGPVLPVRFGVVFESERELRHELDARSAQLAWALERVRGKVEIGVRVVPTAEPPSPAIADHPLGAGARYLHSRLQRKRDAAERSRPVHEALAPLAAATRARLLPQADTLSSAAFLVDAAAVAAFEREAARIERSSAGIAILCTGPWPPYNFVDPDWGEQ